MKKTKSYYFTVFIRLILIFMVMILMNVMIFVQAKAKIEAQIMVTKRNTLEQSLYYVDEVMENAVDTMISIVFSTTYKTNSNRFVAEPDKHAYLAWLLKEQLSDYVNEKYYDIFVYYPGNDYVISASNSIARLENYYTLNYAAKGVSYDQFEQIANSSVKKAVVYSICGSNDEIYPCIAMRSGYATTTDKEYVVVFVLNQNYIKSMVQEIMANDEGEGIFFIANGDKEIVFRTRNDIDEEVIDVLQLVEQEETYECEIGDTEYLLLSLHSKNVNCFYFYAISINYFRYVLREVYLTFYLGLAISVVLGVINVYWQSRGIYRPFGDAMARLQKKSNSQWNAKVSTEFEFIEMIFDSEQMEKNKLNLTVRQGKLMKRDVFVSSLFEGKTVTLDSSENDFADNGITLCSDNFYVALFEVEEWGNLEKNLHLFVVTNVLEELFSKTHKGYVISIADDRYGMLINTDCCAEDQSVETLIEEGRIFLKEHFGMQFTVSISAEKQGMSRISEAYREAAEAMKYRYLLRETLIRYPEIKARTFKWPDNSRQQYAFADFMAEKSCDRGQALEYIDECLKKYQIDQYATLEMVDCFVFEVVNSFNWYICQFDDVSTEWKENIRKLTKSETLAEFRENFADLLMEVYEKRQKSEKENNICARAKGYIEHHYQDSQLSLAELSKKFGLTPSYFSKMFKDNYHMSIPDYINITRINEAKKMLCDTSESVYNIAIASGFLESSTFIRTFKKMEGITPGAYRSLMKNGQLDT